MGRLLQHLRKQELRLDGELRKFAMATLFRPGAGVRVVVGCPVTLIFLALCFLATVLGERASSLLLLRSWRHVSLASSYRLFTWVVAHQDMHHFFANCSLLVSIAPGLEAHYGASNFLHSAALPV